MKYKNVQVRFWINGLYFLDRNDPEFQHLVGNFENVNFKHQMTSMAKYLQDHNIPENEICFLDVEPDSTLWIGEDTSPVVKACFKRDPEFMKTNSIRFPYFVG